ncbi:TPA: hypothetical protein ACGCM8_000001, partial [Bacillus cereus]
GHTGPTGGTGPTGHTGPSVASAYAFLIRMTPQDLAGKDTVIFDAPPQLSQHITYNHTDGKITLQDTGTYLVEYNAAAQGATGPSAAPGLGLRLTPGGEIDATRTGTGSPASTATTITGGAIISISNSDTTLELLNPNSGPTSSMRLVNTIPNAPSVSIRILKIN